MIARYWEGSETQTLDIVRIGLRSKKSLKNPSQIKIREIGQWASWPVFLELIKKINEILAPMRSTYDSVEKNFLGKF